MIGLKKISNCEWKIKLNIEKFDTVLVSTVTV